MNASQPQSDKQFGNWGLNPDEQSGDPDGEVEKILHLVASLMMKQSEAKLRLLEMLREAHKEGFKRGLQHEEYARQVDKQLKGKA